MRAAWQALPMPTPSRPDASPLRDALRGVRVVDFSRLLPGPLATRWLVEHGADVIKVEDPAGGDMTRWVPPLLEDAHGTRSSLFELLNAGKRSVALDLREPAGRSAAEALVAHADVVFESFRPGVLARYGLGPEQVRQRAPKIVYASLSGWGQSGPDAGRAGHDLGYLARSGVLGRSPSVPGMQVADVGGAMVAVAGIAMALFRRERTGEGAVLDLSLGDAALPFGTMAWARLLGGEAAADELLDGSRPAYTLYEVADGHLAVGALEPKFWAAFCRVIGREDLLSSGLDGGGAGARVREEVQEILRGDTRAAWVQRFHEVDACVEPVLLPHEVPADAHHRARGAFGENGRPRSPWSAAAGPSPEPAPSLGRDTERVLTEAGVDEATRAKVLARAPGPSSD